MWIFTRYGFFSVSYMNKDTLMVRARSKKHLESLRKHFVLLKDCATIYTDLNRDYRFRMLVPRDAWAMVLVKLSQEQTWSNIKNECERFTRDSIYVRAMHHVWQVMFKAGVDWELKEGEKK